ncbi:hypothetical protein PspLS_10133 [Pyricularia sp. CBS 133598]|nr:hypothetical protein PspLS_10133 [Pyricularia sp. CBS 133598]
MPSDHRLRDAEEGTHQDTKRELANIFGSIQKLSQVCSHLEIESDKLVDPEILVQDCPQLDFPVSHQDADYILLLEGDQEGLTGGGLDISKIRLRNLKWDSFLNGTILPTVLPKLGLENVKLDPPVLRIQAPGTQRYNLSTEEQKDKALSGGISIFLPSIQKGGYVECSCPGLTEDGMLAQRDDSSYDEATYWFGPLLNGHHVSLVYGFSIQSQDNRMARPIPPAAGLFDRLEQALRCSQSSDPGAFRLVIPLPATGQYFGAGTRACQQLGDFSRKAGFHSFLAQMTHAADEHDLNVRRDDPIAWSISLSDIITVEAETKLKQHEIDSLLVHNHDPKCYWALDDCEEDSNHDNLNEDDDADEDEDAYDCTCRKTVHHEVILLVSHKHLYKILPAVGKPDHVDNLVRLVLLRCQNIKEWDEELDSATVRFFTDCVRGRYIHRPYKTLGLILQWARRNFEDSLYRACLRAVGALQAAPVGFFSGLGEILEDELSHEMSYSRTKAALSSILRGFVSQVDKLGLSALDLILSTLREGIRCQRLRTKFDTWQWAVLERKLRKKRSFDDSDLCFIIKSLDNSGGFLSSMCIVMRIQTEYSSLEPELPNPSKHLRATYGNEDRLALSGSDIKDTWSTEPYHSGSWFISIVVQSLKQRLMSSLLPIIKSSCPVFDIGLPRDGTLAFRDMSIAGFLGDMCQSLQDASSPLDKEHEQVSTPVTLISVEDSKAVFETLLFLKSMPTRYVAESFTGWALASRGCRELDCVDCAVLDALLGHETVIVAHFDEKSLYGGLDHLVGQLTKRTAEWPEPFNYSITGEIGSQTVTITKKEEELRAMAQRSYDYAMRSLRRRVAPLRNDYMKQILGHRLYGELVLLGEEDQNETPECDQGLTGTDSDCDSESTKTCGDVAQSPASSLKRPARSSPDLGATPKRRRMD